MPKTSRIRYPQLTPARCATCNAIIHLDIDVVDKALPPMQMFLMLDYKMTCTRCGVNGRIKILRHDLLKMYAVHANGRNWVSGVLRDNQGHALKIVSGTNHGQTLDALTRLFMYTVPFLPHGMQYIQA